jgi:hypothetical protein
MTSDSGLLSLAELNALRRVGHGLANFLAGRHRERLASLALITTDGRGRLVLTQHGRERLATEDALGPAAPSPPGSAKPSPPS